MSLRQIRLNFIRKYEGRKGSGWITIIYGQFRKAGLFFLSAKKNRPVSLSSKTILEYNKTRTNQLSALICNAPFTNIYFGYGGKIGVCCYNRIHLLGVYPENDIKQAWTGKKSKELREKIKVCDLTAGCYCCQVQWVEKAYRTVLARNYDGYKPGGKYPLSMEFELSNRCNLKCIMCSEENSSAIAREKFGQSEKLLPYDDAFIEQLDDFIPHLKIAKFLGGEPFLIPIYYKIWERIIQLNPNCEMVIQTNGTILNDKIKTLLKKGNFSISISIDSLVKETYENIRKPAVFDLVYGNLMYYIEFCKANNRFIGIACCFMQQNWKEIPDLLRFFNEKQVPVTFNRVWAPPNCSIWESTYELTSEILEFYKEQHFSTKTIIEQKNVAAFHDLMNQVSQWNLQEKLKAESKFEALNTPAETLENMIKQHIFETDTAVNFSDEQKNQIHKKLNRGLEKFKAHPNYKILLLKVLEIPGEILQREILNNSDERIEQQIHDIVEQKTEN